MSITRISLLLLLALAGSACRDGPVPAQPVSLGNHIDAGGLVEPVGEERLIIPQVTGRVQQVLVDEGDVVAAGQLLAELENDEQRATLAAAQAELAMRQAELAALRAGARPEELSAARAAADEAAALQHQASAELVRRQRMAERDLISTEALEEARTRAATAAAVRQRVAAELALLEAGTRQEDLDAAAAALDGARAQQQRAAAALEKTRIHSPIDGIVLKRMLNAGETVTALSPEPLAMIGDLSQLMVRADIDELDIGRVRVGAAAKVRSDAFPGQTFAGELVRISRRMGQRKALSDDPTQRRDAKTMEALIALAPGAQLPVGLRVDVRISTSQD